MITDEQITGKNITDEQIREMQREYNAGSVSYELCALALCKTPGVTKRFDRLLSAGDARARCAEILEARTRTDAANGIFSDDPYAGPTDAQLRELLNDSEMHARHAACALYAPDAGERSRERARCAEILEGRRAKEAK